MATPRDPPIVAPASGRRSQVWRVARYLFALGAVGAALWVISGKTDELQGATGYLANMRWGWLLVAVGAEAASYLATSSLQRRLLMAGGVRTPVPAVVGISLAGGAIQNSLPGGFVFWGAYAYRQYRRFGASEILAAWAFIAMNAVSFITLAGVAAIGLGMALSAGSTYDLVEAILGIAILAMLFVIGWIERARVIPHAARLVGLSQRLFRRPDPRLSPAEVLDHWLQQIGAISPSRGDWARAAVMGLSNWLADLGCLTFAFFAVGSGVPWRGLLLAYGAGQLASVLPFTPGGLGVVEGSLTIALVDFGGGEASTVAAVLLYRLISFWLLLPVGWGAWTALALAGRGRKPALQEAAA